MEIGFCHWPFLNYFCTNPFREDVKNEHFTVSLTLRVDPPPSHGQFFVNYLVGAKNTVLSPF